MLDRELVPEASSGLPRSPGEAAAAATQNVEELKLELLRRVVAMEQLSATPLEATKGLSVVGRLLRRRGRERRDEVEAKLQSLRTLEAEVQAQVAALVQRREAMQLEEDAIAYGGWRLVHKSNEKNAQRTRRIVPVKLQVPRALGRPLAKAARFSRKDVVYVDEDLRVGGDKDGARFVYLKDTSHLNKLLAQLRTAEADAVAPPTKAEHDLAAALGVTEELAPMLAADPHVTIPTVVLKPMGSDAAGPTEAPEAHVTPESHNRATEMMKRRIAEQLVELKEVKSMARDRVHSQPASAQNGAAPLPSPVSYHVEQPAHKPGVAGSAAKAPSAEGIKVDSMVTDAKQAAPTSLADSQAAPLVERAVPAATEVHGSWPAPSSYHVQEPAPVAASGLDAVEAEAAPKVARRTRTRPDVMASQLSNFKLRELQMKPEMAVAKAPKKAGDIDMLTMRSRLHELMPKDAKFVDDASDLAGIAPWPAPSFYLPSAAGRRRKALGVPERQAALGGQTAPRPQAVPASFNRASETRTRRIGKQLVELRELQMAARERVTLQAPATRSSQATVAIAPGTVMATTDMRLMQDLAQQVVHAPRKEITHRTAPEVPTAASVDVKIVLLQEPTMTMSASSRAGDALAERGAHAAESEGDEEEAVRAVRAVLQEQAVVVPSTKARGASAEFMAARARDAALAPPDEPARSLGSLGTLPATVKDTEPVEEEKVVEKRSPASLLLDDLIFAQAPPEPVALAAAAEEASESDAAEAAPEETPAEAVSEGKTEDAAPSAEPLSAEDSSTFALLDELFDVLEDD